MIATLSLHQLTLNTRIGVHAWEQQVTQTILADITLEIDIEKAANSDDLNDTLDYDALAQHLCTLAQDWQTKLLESFGQKCLTAIEQFASRTNQSLKQTTMTLTKPSALAHAKGVSITITR